MRADTIRPYNQERTSLEFVGAIINRPAVRRCVFTPGFGENEMHAVRADSIRTYNQERTSLESVGAIINRPAVRRCVFTPGFGE